MRRVRASTCPIGCDRPALSHDSTPPRGCTGNFTPFYEAVAAPSPVPVACAVILDQGGRVLLAQRPSHKHLALQWEFPGGKIEAGESAANALVREIDEELGCQIEIRQALPPHVHHYGTVSVEMHPFVCRLADPAAVPAAHEHAALAWVRPDAIRDYDLAAADLPILDSLAFGSASP